MVDLANIHENIIKKKQKKFTKFLFHTFFHKFTHHTTIKYPPWLITGFILTLISFLSLFVQLSYHYFSLLLIFEDFILEAIQYIYGHWL